MALLYVDGAHRYGPARADLAGWGRRVVPGGAMLVHDAFSSVGVTLALLTECVFSSRWRYAGRTGSLAEYERACRCAGRARARNALRQLAELPWFARNLAIKALVVARLRDGPLAVLSVRASARTSRTTAATVTQWTAIRSCAYSELKPPGRGPGSASVSSGTTDQQQRAGRGDERARRRSRARG